MLSQAMLLLALASLTSLQLTCAQVTEGEIKYQNLKNWGASNQFAMEVAVGKISSGNADQSDFDEGNRRSLTPCASQEYQNPSSDACNYPPIQDDSADVIRVKIGLRDTSPDAKISCIVKGPEFADDNRQCSGPDSEGGVCQPSTATHLEARLCYSKTAYQERPWRKKNRAYPELSLLCPWKLEKISIDASNLGNKEWTATKEVGPSYVLTKVSMGRTPGVVAAATVFSVFSIVFLVVYTVADNIWYNKTGKGLTFGVA
ncbi:hypothetical protein DUNSADRAFT_1809 [Dunaliella salina]|uniref:Uncharacterized protein n=1 Tax=Dunaliella salina TaxID=3046 RepID=A0ABQ7FX15_DUNSA|nr:hypothetical protein DUNSADRAFT_1809 [Dunaliella salina]KAF5826895.1 hypothetical protein DUNSADRAFT_1809 [Dunaliella salina]|eukprot:KAF5826894.1 hypothetical protein DUNSADRAFT_1809 [Dunaliella salina]